MLSDLVIHPRSRLAMDLVTKVQFGICFVLLIPKLSVFYLWVGRVVLAQSNQSYEGSADHFQAALGPHIPSSGPPPPGVVEQSPAHFLHTCTCGAQGCTLVGTQAQFWSGAEASNILGQTLRAKLYKSISTL